MPGTTPAASQLDWLISSTTTMVLFCSKAIRERLRSLTWVMGAPPSVFAQRQRCQTFAAVPIASGPGADIEVLGENDKKFTIRPTMAAAPITSAGCFSPLGPGHHLPSFALRPNTRLLTAVYRNPAYIHLPRTLSAGLEWWRRSRNRPAPNLPRHETAQRAYARWAVSWRGRLGAGRLRDRRHHSNPALKVRGKWL